MSISELITPFHLGRQALIYIRQSSPHQVLTNQESRRLQYALRQRALECGWAADAIEVIDADLGRTARTTQGRQGFKELVARVTLDQVGIIFSYDVTRLARNCTDWYQVLDLCGYRRCLIGDRDGIYDPATINGRLLLGLKGQISELELHTHQGPADGRPAQQGPARRAGPDPPRGPRPRPAGARREAARPRGPGPHRPRLRHLPPRPLPGQGRPVIQRSGPARPATRSVRRRRLAPPDRLLRRRDPQEPGLRRVVRLRPDPDREDRPGPHPGPEASAGLRVADPHPGRVSPLHRLGHF